MLADDARKWSTGIYGALARPATHTKTKGSLEMHGLAEVLAQSRMPRVGKTKPVRAFFCGTACMQGGDPFIYETE